MKVLGILGSTGSIGKQALEVVAQHPKRFSVAMLAANSNDALLEQQIEQFNPQVAVLFDKAAADRLTKRYRGSTVLLAGEEGLIEASVHPRVETLLTAVVGFAGVKPTLSAIQAGKSIALANKETLVAAGEIVMPLARAKRVPIIPVDSEHSAIFQALQGEKITNVNKLILTASGGPFRTFSAEALSKVTVEDCLKHPTWNMGRKITVDCATMANKGLEVIEAHWLFGLDYEQIEVVVHPQSVIHSMVEFVDGSIIAQLAPADMRLPIQYALAYPERLPSAVARLNFGQHLALDFGPPDLTLFPALQLAYRVGKRGGSLPCVFSAANEVAVDAFLAERISFTEIPALIGQVVDAHRIIDAPKLPDLVAADAWARDTAVGLITNRKARI